MFINWASAYDIILPCRLIAGGLKTRSQVCCITEQTVAWGSWWEVFKWIIMVLIKHFNATWRPSHVLEFIQVGFWFHFKNYENACIHDHPYLQGYIMYLNYTCTVLSINEYSPLNKYKIYIFFLIDNAWQNSNVINTYLKEIQGHLKKIYRISWKSNFFL